MRFPSADDLWLPVPEDGLPADLLEARNAGDWTSVRERVGTAARGVYGRQAIRFRATVPLGVDPILAQHRGWSALSFGDWDDLERVLAAAPADPVELAGLRDIVLAPLGRSASVESDSEVLRPVFGAWTFSLNGAVGRYRRLVRSILGWRSESLARSRGVSPARHARFRRLQETFLLAMQESLGGRLPVAAALCEEAERLGEAGDVLRLLARDLGGGVAAASGSTQEWPLAYGEHLSTPRGHSPLDAAPFLLALAPFLALRRDDALASAIDLAEGIAIRFGSPRLLVAAESWRLASAIADRDAAGKSAALLIKARQASAGLRALPLLLDGIASGRSERFAEAELTAREAGAIWIQVSALTWSAALDPNPTVLRWLHRALVVSGWRRPALVPAQVAGEAALGLSAAGHRCQHAVELAQCAGRPNVTYEVARRVVDDPAAPQEALRAAAEALGQSGTTHARELLQRLARRGDDVGRAAASHLQRHHSVELTEREVEVLDLAANGLTNKEIAARLTLSAHTVARHLVNARAKLGATNRAEAAAKLAKLRG